MIYLERTRSFLSLAVKPEDDIVPDKRPEGDVFLEAKGARKKIIEHNTGYFLLIDLPAGKHALKCWGKFYKESNLMVDTKDIDPKVPFIQMTLLQRSNYPFPDGLTILKGKVVDADNRPIPGATIEIEDGINTISEDVGGFFFSFADQDGDKDYTLNIEKTGYEQAQVNVFLNKGKTTRIDTIILIKN
jgi:hypothetical protein